MPTLRLFAAIAGALVCSIAACGGGSSTQSGPAAPSASALPDPTVVCKKMVRLATEGLNTEGHDPEKDMSNLLQECITRSQHEKDTNPPAYACESDCVMRAQHGSELDPCMDACPQ